MATCRLCHGDGYDRIAQAEGHGRTPCQHCGGTGGTSSSSSAGPVGCATAVLLVAAVVVGLPVLLWWGSRQGPLTVDGPETSRWAGPYRCTGGDIWLTLTLELGPADDRGRRDASGTVDYADAEDGEPLDGAAPARMRGSLEDRRLRLLGEEGAAAHPVAPRGIDAQLADDLASLAGEVVSDACARIDLRSVPGF